MLEHLAILPLAALIGVVLGALGSGGAILALPILVYGALLPVRQAVAVSQLVIGTAALVGTLLQARTGRIVWREVILFAVVGVPATRLGSLAAGLVDTKVLLLAFSLVMVAAGIGMAASTRTRGGPTETHVFVSMVAGGLVGFLTGLLGVGGGFMLVPALIAFGGMDAKRATASSLPVIAVNTLSGAIGQHALWEPVFGLAMSFLGATLVGTFVGLRMGRAASELKLKQALGIVMVFVGILVGVMNLR
jgi:uncharacterized membrane protein YfcA